jgi:hypothetical protein
MAITSWVFLTRRPVIISYCSGMAVRSYGYDATDFGGRLRISSGNREAITAVHDFLRFQISDHETGDSTEVTAQK